MALASGATTYVGSPCVKGHGSIRRTAGGACVECCRASQRARYAADPETNKARATSYASRPDVVQRRRAKSKTQAEREKNRVRMREARKTPKGAITHRMTSRIRAGLTGARRGSGWQDVLGYTVDDLKVHLERQFRPGMSWANMGEWHIDHILPLKLFSYSSMDDDDFKAAWAITNLRPMWAGPNMKKHARREVLL